MIAINTRKIKEDSASIQCYEYNKIDVTILKNIWDHTKKSKQSMRFYSQSDNDLLT